MAIERKVDRDTKEVVDSRDMCQSCGKYRAKLLVDVHAATMPFIVRACKRCGNALLRAHPASSAVNIQQYEQ